jgi:hypothetical protein
MQQLVDVLRPWQEFYALLGTASATMVGLLFVAASLGAGVFSSDRRAAMRVFLSASVVNFSLVLATCLIALSPARSWLMIGMMILGSGMFGLAHCCLAWRDTLRDSLLALMDLEDRVWYIVLPFIGYACVAASGVTLALRLDIGCVALALSAGLLMAVGIHNAWDITVWSISRRQQ